MNLVPLGKQALNIISDHSDQSQLKVLLSRMSIKKPLDCILTLGSLVTPVTELRKTSGMNKLPGQTGEESGRIKSWQCKQIYLLKKNEASLQTLVLNSVGFDLADLQRQEVRQRPLCHSRVSEMHPHHNGMQQFFHITFWLKLGFG